MDPRLRGNDREIFTKSMDPALERGGYKNAGSADLRLRKYCSATASSIFVAKVPRDDPWEFGRKHGLRSSAGRLNLLRAHQITRFRQPKRDRFRAEISFLATNNAWKVALSAQGGPASGWRGAKNGLRRNPYRFGRNGVS